MNHYAEHATGREAHPGAVNTLSIALRNFDLTGIASNENRNN
jgi:hypothetical protein